PRPRPLLSTPFPYTTLFRSFSISVPVYQIISYARVHSHFSRVNGNLVSCVRASTSCFRGIWRYSNSPNSHHCSRYASNNCVLDRSEEHTSELQSRFDLVCRL